MEIIETVFAETALGEGGEREPRQPRLVGRLGHAAVSDARRKSNATHFKTGPLKIKPDAILERHQFDVEITNVFAF